MIKMTMIGLLLVAISGVSFAGDCYNGSCVLQNKPVRKVVTISKEIVVKPIQTTSNSVRDIIKYQPLRGRLVNRTTVVNNIDCQ